VHPRGVPRPDQTCYELIRARPRAIDALFWARTVWRRTTAQVTAFRFSSSGSMIWCRGHERRRRETGVRAALWPKRRGSRIPTSTNRPDRKAARQLPSIRGGLCPPERPRSGRPRGAILDHPQAGSRPARVPPSTTAARLIPGTPRPAPVLQAPFDLTPIECLPALLDRGAFRFWNERPWASVTPVGGARVTRTSWGGCRHAQPAFGRAHGSCRMPGSIHTNLTPGGLHGRTAFLLLTGNRAGRDAGM
jgi:hypothetical protein